MAKAELFPKDLPKSERVFYYKTEEDDPIETKEQKTKSKSVYQKTISLSPKIFF